MRRTLVILAAVSILSLPAFAQMGGGAPDVNNGLDQLFTANPVFSATMQTVITSPGGPLTVSEQMYFDHGNWRTDMNMANVHGGNLPPNALTQMKNFGLDQVITITPAAKTNVFLIYPIVHSYVSTPTAAPPALPSAPQMTKIGSDTVDGHPCIENKVVVNDAGQQHEFTTWNATDLHNFPLKISITEQNSTATISFQNISFKALSSSLFQPPANDKRFDSIQNLMQSVMMSRMGAAPAPAAPAPPNP